MSTINPTTYFSLMAEFQAAHVPIEVIAKKYYDHAPSVAKRKAAENSYPFPVIKLPGQKSPWLVDIRDFAEYLEKERQKARKEFEQSH